MGSEEQQSATQTDTKAQKAKKEVYKPDERDVCQRQLFIAVESDQHQQESEAHSVTEPNKNTNERYFLSDIINVVASEVNVKTIMAHRPSPIPPVPGPAL